MRTDSQSDIVERGIALHKMIRLVTLATAGDGYLNFMGNEFGHPEWIDFPREGNGWSFKYARRQWPLADDENLRYGYLRNFDREIISLAKASGFLSERPEIIVADEEKKILIFKRMDYIFALNFNPVSSFSDYGFAAPAGEYTLALDSDESRFDGFSRLKEGEKHFTLNQRCPNGNQNFDSTLYLYLPSRCAVVLKRK